MAKRARKHNFEGTYYDNMYPHYDKCPDFYYDGTHDVWEGRRPHNIDATTGYAEYRTWFGDAVISVEGNIVSADVSLNRKVHVYIIGNRLKIYDIRNDGICDSWGYAIAGSERCSIWPSNHELEDERIDSMLREKNIDCPIWVKVCKRAREMWLSEIAGRDPLYRYTPDYND